jgi:glycosyltransferase 2 family protein
VTRTSTAWRWSRRLLALAFFATVGTLLVLQAREIDWAEVGRTMRQTPPGVLAGAAALVVLSYLLYGSYDLLGRAYTGHRLPIRRVLPVALVSYAFNLNMGALVGGAGFRFRLYSRLGLSPGRIARVLAIAVSSNWSGFVLLAGLLMSFERLRVPLQWQLGAGALQVAGIVLLLVVAAYPLFCAWSPRRSWTIRGHELRLPSWRLALLQLALSTLNWLVIAAIIHLLLPPLPYLMVLGVMLLAAVAGAMAHIPAGLGVLEALFVMTLSSRVPTPTLLAALLTYRALYYLLPLLVALPVYFAIEAGASGRARQAAETPAHE